MDGLLFFFRMSINTGLGFQFKPVLFGSKDLRGIDICAVQDLDAYRS
jgi:hypothetical protein